MKFGEEFKDLRIATLAEILQKLAGHTVMNIHIKPLSDHYDPALAERIVRTIRRYDCEKHVYFMIKKDADVALFRSLAPEIPICLGHDSDRPWEIVDRAIAVGADKVQFYKPYFDQAMVDKAKAHGIKYNVFYADTVEEAQKYLDMGMDTVLTNRYNVLAAALK